MPKEKVTKSLRYFCPYSLNDKLIINKRKRAKLCQQSLNVLQSQTMKYIIFELELCTIEQRKSH